MKLSIVVPSYRDIDLLARTLPLLIASASCDLELLVVNNDPTQDVRGWIARNPILRTRTNVIDMAGNAGFSRAVNKGIAATSGELVFVCNSDLFVSEAFGDTIVAFFTGRPAAGCATGKILRYDLHRDRPLDIIDSAGLAVARSRRVVDRGEGSRDEGQFDREEQVFGATGTCMIIRRSALESVRIASEYFDETFFMYKEDVDLSWRLRLAGWECWYVPAAVAYHVRTSSGLGSRSYASAVSAFHRNERRKPHHVRLHSMKNHWIVLVKNEDASNFARDLPFIVGRELLVLGYNLVFSPRIAVRALAGFAQTFRVARIKRAAIKERQRVSARSVRRWLVGASWG